MPQNVATGKGTANGRENSPTRGERTRGAIVVAARERIAEVGYDATKLADVAAEAGVSEPTVAFHFGGKAGLLIAVMRDHYDALVPEIEAVVHEPSDPRGRLEAFARFWLRSHERHFELHATFLSEGGWRTSDPEIRAALREQNRRVTRIFERLVDDLKAEGSIAAEVPTRLVRDVFLGAAEHAFRGWPTTPEQPDVDRVADQILRLTLRGSAPGPAATATPATLEAIDRKLDLLIDSQRGK